MQHMFDITIAAEFGLKEAVLVHRLYTLILANEANGRNERNGKFWTYDSAAAIQRNCPYFSVREVEGIIQRCRKKGLIETAQLSTNPRDRTNWYTVSDTVRAIYAHGGMHSTLGANGSTSTGECTFTPKRECIKGTIKTYRDTIESARTRGEFDNVVLSEEELDKLHARWGEDAVQKELENLSGYMASTGKKYKSHYATLLNWLKRDFPEGAAEETPRVVLEDEPWA